MMIFDGPACALSTSGWKGWSTGRSQYLQAMVESAAVRSPQGDLWNLPSGKLT